jgi:hypothetical protein
MGEIRSAYRVLIGKPKAKIPPARLNYRCEDNIKMDIKWDVIVWTGFIWFNMGEGVSGVLF